MGFDFDTICLLPSEKFKLFCMRFKKTVTILLLIQLHAINRLNVLLLLLKNTFAIALIVEKSFSIASSGRL